MSKETAKETRKTLLEKMMKQMLLIRRFEEKAGQMYGLRKIGGFCHLYIGQEAVAVGSIAALDLARDYVVTAYRDHGHALACGMDPNGVMAELYGKATGCSKGKGGSMHMFDKEKHMLGGNGIVGGQLPVAAGAALTIRNKKQDGVVLCFFGDGAIHQGSFHESLNLAKIYHLPVIYICENNQYGMGTDFRRVSAVENLSVMGASYGIEGKQVDGMNPLTVYEAVNREIQELRKNPGPAFLEIRTYRYKGHSMSDPATYRTKEELEQYKERDPIKELKEVMLSEKLLTEEVFKKWDKEAKEISAAAVAFSEESPEPEPQELYTDIFV
jgi:pyruvate dehydrogenase E1 component alpha subunit